VNHTRQSEPGEGLSLLQTVLAYHRRGWSIIPIKLGTKKPACYTWKRYQTERPNQAQLRRWFGRKKLYGLAVVCGEASGGLVCRDFDTMEGYPRWAKEHPDLAAILPTVATARGMHVYFVAKVRKIIPLADGELRGAGYCLLPPSRHPGGLVYRWQVPLPDGEIPFVEDVRAAGFLDQTPRATENTEKTEEHRGQLRTTEPLVGVLVVESTTPTGNEEVERAIAESLPTRTGHRNQQVMDLARALKAIHYLADAPADELKPYVLRWHKLALPHISTKPFEETWIDFLRAWPRVKFPKGTEPMVAIFKQANESAVPRAALGYEIDGLRLLASLCRELQRASGDKPFFLSCRTAGRLLEVDHTTAWRWLFLLAHDRIIEEVEKGDRTKRRASRYRYLAD